MKILENISRAPYTTFGIGGLARYFCVATSVQDVYGAVDFARRQNISFIILGGGSNILFSDENYSGLVIKIELKGIVFEQKDTHEVLLTAQAGESWDTVVARSVEEGLWGLENLSGIPGTVGASPVQNIGAYGVEVKDTIESVVAIDTNTGNEKVFTRDECQFGYRTSIFKKVESKRYVILSVVFRLSTIPKPHLGYKDIAEYFKSKHTTEPSLSDIREAVVVIRTGKFPDLSVYGTAGSFWKNPCISTQTYTELVTKYPGLPSFVVDTTTVKIPLAWILDAVCGLKGYTKGSVGLFHKQPLVLVAGKQSTSKQVYDFSLEIARMVKDKTGISIEPEVEHITP